MSEPGKAVFLSYASQDAEAARRIADALRAAGVEVWFDADGGLEHGDEWDAKIRRQIKECVLFIPIISATTQAREEGYFRIEWDLAAERARGIASGVAFILPVVIDDTREPDALVPDRFRTVQWTRLPGGNVLPEVLQRFLKLWSHRTGVLKHAARTGQAEDPGGGALTPDSSELSRRKAAPTARRSPRWLTPVLGGVVVAAIAALAIWQPWKRSDSDLLAPRSSPPAADSTTEARQLLAKVWVLLNKPGLDRADLELADDYCKQADALEPNNADVLAAWSQVDTWFVYHNFEPTPQRRQAAQDKSTRAMQLAPRSFEARLAYACLIVRCGPTNSLSLAAPEAERILRELLQERPDEPRALDALAILLRNANRTDEALALFDRLATNPAFAATAWNEKGYVLFFGPRNYRAAKAAASQSAAREVFWGNLGLEIYLALIWDGNLDAARDLLNQMPAATLAEDWGVIFSNMVFRWRREPEKVLQACTAIPRDWLSSNAYTGPKRLLTGDAYAMAGRAGAARIEWQAALELVEQRLVARPSDPNLYYLKGRLLAHLGQVEAARSAFALDREFRGGGLPSSEALWLGDADGAIRNLEQRAQLGPAWITAAELRLDPDFDSLRADPRFQALRARLDADQRFSPTAEEKLKNAGPVSTGALPAPSVLSPASGLQSPSSPPPADAKSVAVLAFTNLSDDKNNEYFSDGISEELLNVLQKIPGLHVAARVSSFSFKGRDATAQEIGRDLGVADLVEGSVQKSGNRVKVTARLSRAATGEELWSDSYTRELKDVFALEDELATAIVGELRGQLGVPADIAAVKAAVKGGTTNPEAYEEYLQGRYRINLFSFENIDAAIAHFQRATLLDPDFALAWAALSRAQSLRLGWTDKLTRPQSADLLAQARRAADRALQLQPDLPEALAALFELQFTFGFDWKAGADTIRRALAEAPSDPALLASASRVAGIFGDPSRAVDLMQQAVKLDPVNSEFRNSLGLALLAAGRLPEARTEFARALELNPQVIWAHFCIGMTYLYEGKFWEGAAACQQDPLEAARLYGRAIGEWELHHRPEADAALAGMIAGYADTFAFQVAEIYSIRGDKDAAFAWLERARRQQDSGFTFMPRDPLFDSLHSDPRWEKFQRSMGLTKEQLQ